MTKINITLAEMTEAHVDCLSELIKKEVQTLTAAERTELLNKLREIKKGSAKHE